MSRRLLGPVAQVFLGAALALPPTLLGWAFWTAARTDGSPLTLLTLLGLAVLAVAVVALVALAPAVRPVEVAAARSLLGVDLPDPLVPEARESRLLGAAWVGVCALVGGTVLFLLLLLVPRHPHWQPPRCQGWVQWKAISSIGQTCCCAGCM